jgi:hypothetical protein
MSEFKYFVKTYKNGNITVSWLYRVYPDNSYDYWIQELGWKPCGDAFSNESFMFGDVTIDPITESELFMEML